jgi:hypothetical protein
MSVLLIQTTLQDVSRYDMLHLYMEKTFSGIITTLSHESFILEPKEPIEEVFKKIIAGKGTPIHVDHDKVVILTVSLPIEISTPENDVAGLKFQNRLFRALSKEPVEKVQKL